MSATNSIPRQPAPATFSDEHREKVEALAKEFDKAEAELMRKAHELHEPLFKKRAEILSKVDKFWPQALVNCVSTNIYIDDDDHEALSYITDIKVHRDASDPRPAKVEFVFSENPFFSNTSLVKEFTLDSEAAELGPEFDFAQDLVPKKTEIEWKSDDKNLVKKKPTEGGRDSDSFEPGSFFSSFFANEDKEVSGGIGAAIVDEFFPNAIQYYTGEHDDSAFLGMDDEDDEDDEEDEEDDDDDKEIDLEEEESRPKKKTKTT